MSARSHGLLATRYTLHAGEGGAGATATRRLTGLFARSTALSILGEEFTLIGGGDRYCLVTRSADTVGSISIFNPGAGPREWRGTLEFQQRFGVAAQAFVFWVAVNKTIQNHNSSSA